jgi:hypothetical protein
MRHVYRLKRSERAAWNVKCGLHKKASATPFPTTLSAALNSASLARSLAPRLHFFLTPDSGAVSPTVEALSGAITQNVHKTIQFNSLNVAKQMP